VYQVKEDHLVVQDDQVSLVFGEPEDPILASLVHQDHKEPLVVLEGLLVHLAFLGLVDLLVHEESQVQVGSLVSEVLQVL